MKPGDVIDGYELKWRLGAGASAQVFLARHRETGTDAAIKLLSDDASIGMRRVFMSEARTLARLKHQHIISVYGIGSDYLITSYVEGNDLSHRLQSPLSPALAVRIIVQIGGGLAHAHEHGIIHRDIKPANILIDKSDNAYLGDFGLAIMASESRASRTGTPAYMAPEIAAAACPPGVSSDLYALGRTLLELLLGHRLSVNPAADLAALAVSLPHRLRAAVARAVDPIASQRWPSVEAFITELQTIDLSSYNPPGVRAEVQWSSKRFDWARLPHTMTAVGPYMTESRYLLSNLIRDGGIPADRASAFKSVSGYEELGWSLFCRTDRLGPSNDPGSLARASSVVVIFPGMAYSRDTWRHVTMALCRDNAQTAVLTAELHGFCDSRYGPSPPAEDKLTGRGSMGAVLAWLELLGLRDLPLTLVGHSLSTVPLMSYSDDELGGNVNRLLVSPILPWVNRLWKYYLFGLPWIDGFADALAPVIRPLFQYRIRKATRLLDGHLQEAATAELGRYPMAVFARAGRAWTTARGVAGTQLRRCKWLCGTHDEIVSRAATERAVADLGFDRANLHWCVSNDHYPHLSKRHAPEEASRNVDQIVHIINTLLRDVSSLSSGPTASTQ